MKEEKRTQKNARKKSENESHRMKSVLSHGQTQPPEEEKRIGKNQLKRERINHEVSKRRKRRGRILYI